MMLLAHALEQRVIVRFKSKSVVGSAMSNAQGKSTNENERNIITYPSSSNYNNGGSGDDGDEESSQSAR